MREILFRGKRLDDGVWVYGNLFISEIDNRTYILAESSRTITEREVDPSTVGQYTGLRDGGGRQIFEGDILRIAKISDGLGSYYHPPLDYPVNVVVKWDLCAWMWETLCEDKRYISFPNAWCHYECEILGNIHDNPELLDASRCLECLKGAKNKSCLIYKEGCSCGTQDDIKCLQQPAE